MLLGVKTTRAIDPEQGLMIDGIHANTIAKCCLDVLAVILLVITLLSANCYLKTPFLLFLCLLGMTTTSSLPLIFFLPALFAC